MTNPNSTNSNRKNIQLSVIIGAISILIVVIVLLIKENFTNDQKYFFKILFALGCAGVAATIPGFFDIKYKKILSAGGALAVFLFVYKNNPVTNSSKFHYVIYLKDKSSKQIINQKDIKLSMQLGGDVTSGDFSERSHSYKFENIPQEYREINVPIFTTSDRGWVFENSTSGSEIKLTGEFTDLYMKRKCSLTGIVLKDSIGLEGENMVSVYLLNAPSCKTYTDENGAFTLDVSETNITAPYTVVFKKREWYMTYNLDCNINFNQKLLRTR